MTRYPFPPDRSRCVLAVVLLILCAIPTAAQTVLTNESSVEVDLPEATFRTPWFGDDGFVVFVPPGAQALRIVLETNPNAEIELLAQGGRDVFHRLSNGRFTRGNERAQFFEKPDNRGVGEIVITRTSHPPLQDGPTYIGFYVLNDGVSIRGRLTATVSGGTVDSLYSVVESTFDSDAEGWSRNTDTGGSGSSFSYATEKGNPGGFVQIHHTTGQPDDYFVAPDSFNADLLELNDGRITFDLFRITGDSFAFHNVDVVVHGPGGSFKYIGQAAPEIPKDFNFFSGKVDPVWRDYSAPIRRDLWRKIGTANYEVTFRNPSRIEIRARYVPGSGTVGLDNVRIQERGIAPLRPVLPTVSSFSGGDDRWSRNYSVRDEFAGAPVGNPDSRLSWVEGPGNPGGFIRLQEAGEEGTPETDVFVAPSEFTGIYTDLNSPRFEFDFIHKSLWETVAPVTVRTYSEGGTIFEWTGPKPINLWSHMTVPISGIAWTRVAGDEDFTTLVAGLVRVEISAEHARGPEWNAIDNFALLTADSPPLPRALVLDTNTLSFAGAATQKNPDSQDVAVSSAYGELVWQAAVGGDMAAHVSLSRDEGSTPVRVTVQVDTQGLAAGNYNIPVQFSAVGTTLPTVNLTVRVSLSEQPFPTPQLSDNSVTLAANFKTQVSPGALATVFGTNVGGPAGGQLTSYEGALRDMLPTSVNGVRILVYEMFEQMIGEAPIIYIDESQANFQVPFEVEGRASVRIVIDNNGARSRPITVQVVPNSPGIFVFGSNQAVAINSAGSLVVETALAKRQESMVVYMTGQGMVLPNWKTGRSAAAWPLLRSPEEAHVWIGGREARIDFLGLAPGLVGVLQLNVTPVWETPQGKQPMIVNVGGSESNVASVWIK
jgi:uncharacterized protein (TIGR03437 family)